MEIEKASHVLNEDHYGMDDVKTRILGELLSQNFRLMKNRANVDYHFITNCFCRIHRCKSVEEKYTR